MPDIFVRCWRIYINTRINLCQVWKHCLVHFRVYWLLVLRQTTRTYGQFVIAIWKHFFKRFLYYQYIVCNVLLFIVCNRATGISKTFILHFQFLVLGFECLTYCLDRKGKQFQTVSQLHNKVINLEGYCIPLTTIGNAVLKGVVHHVFWLYPSNIIFVITCLICGLFPVLHIQEIIQPKVTIELQVVIIANQISFQTSEILKGFIYWMEYLYILRAKFYNGTCPHFCVRLFPQPFNGVLVPYGSLKITWKVPPFALRPWCLFRTFRPGQSQMKRTYRNRTYLVRFVIPSPS